jgi:CSLREA domain-containing protein
MRRIRTIHGYLLAAAMAMPVVAFAGSAPVNDDWANRIQINPATLLTPGGFSDTQADIALASTAASDPILTCKNGDTQQRGNTVWYGLNFATPGQNFYVNLSALGYDDVVAIFTGTPGNFRPLVGACNDDGASGFAAALAGVQLAGDVDYSIVVARPAQNPNPASLSFNARSAPLYTVTKTSDTLDGQCDADCSLREAISAANAAPGAILIPAGDYTLTRMGSDNTNTNGDLDLTAGMALYGAGRSSTRIFGNGAERVFDLDPGNTLGHTYAFKDLAVSNGVAGFTFGGGINASSGPTPGNEHLAVQRVELSNNTTQLSGGGLRANGPTVVIDSVISGNSAGSDGGGMSFGGDANTRVDVAYSTIDGNTSLSSFSGGGGGIASTSNTFIYNATVSGNQARFNGGGILSTLASGRINLINVTLAENRADSDGNAAGVGGGLRMEGNFGLVQNSVFAGNQVGSGNSADDCSKSDTLNNLNLASNHLEAAVSSCGFSAGTADVLGQPAGLGALADNGGDTRTHLPQTGSAVIDSGSDVLCLGSDQRGIARPQDGDNSGAAQCDKGAVEVELSVPDPIFADGFE